MCLKHTKDYESQIQVKQQETPTHLWHFPLIVLITVKTHHNTASLKGLLLTLKQTWQVPSNFCQFLQLPSQTLNQNASPAFSFEGSRHTTGSHDYFKHNFLCGIRAPHQNTNYKFSTHSKQQHVSLNHFNSHFLLFHLHQKEALQLFWY